MTKQEKHAQLEKILGTSFRISLLANIEYDWKEFYENPEKYANNAIVIDMVNLYLDYLYDGIDDTEE